ncbi:UBX domain-containing protein 2A [Polypterus senegalus]|uniref:UBX domain-containing protein 2A n=1 Tax=Polypterus senegalus TaxID=55291 RepID=UPI001963AABB|nr:UBX domain-containing protein 2A [Polypterus senegalus]XP_039604303.1 UBX domain-containing protein 2A [Polypterus senegalus]
MKDLGNTQKDGEVDGEENCDKQIHMERSFSVEDLLDEVEKIGTVSSSEEKAEIVVKLWKNGFTVNDGSLRSYTDTEDQQFLESIKRGELPHELERSFPEEELEVKVKDYKEEQYIPRKKEFHPFTGQGYRLGSATPKVITKSQPSCEVTEESMDPVVKISDLQPVTNIQIWMADGRRLVQKFNLTHRISDVQSFIEKSQGPSLNGPFILTTSLPFRELNEEDLSLQEAGLQNAVIVQRLLKDESPFGHS